MRLTGSVCGRNNLSKASFDRSGKTEVGVESVIDHSADFSLRTQSLIHWGQ